MEKPSSPRRIVLEDKYLSHHQKCLDLLSTQDFDKAQKLLETLPKHSSFEITTLNNLSIAYSKQKNFNKAVDILLKALAKCKSSGSHKEHLGTLINLNVATSNLNIHTEALSYAQQAKQMLTEADSDLASVVYFNLGLELFYLNRYIESQENLSKSLSLYSRPDNPLASQIKSLITQCIANQYKEPRPCQMIEGLIKKSVKKISSASSIASLMERKHDKIPNSQKNLDKNDKVLRQDLEKLQFEDKIKLKKLQKTQKAYKLQNSLRPENNRAESLLSGRNLQLKMLEKLNGSSTSSTESLSNISNLRNSLISSKSLRKTANSEKSSKQSTPVNKACKSLLKNELRLGSHIQSIGDHLNTLERNMNSFAELCKPLKTLAEDPDEQLDSNRHTNRAQQVLVTRMYRKREAAVKIQRAYRKYRAAKVEQVEKTLLTFKDNPLFKTSFPSIKGKASRSGMRPGVKGK